MLHDFIVANRELIIGRARQRVRGWMSLRSTDANLGVEDFHAFNRCLDDAIAGAVTAYGRHREIDLASDGTERREVLTHELRNCCAHADRPE